MKGGSDTCKMGENVAVCMICENVDERPARAKPMIPCDFCQVYSFHVACVGINNKKVSPDDLKCDSLIFHCPKGYGCNVDENEKSVRN